MNSMHFITPILLKSKRLPNTNARVCSHEERFDGEATQTHETSQSQGLALPCIPVKFATWAGLDQVKVQLYRVES